MVLPRIPFPVSSALYLITLAVVFHFVIPVPWASAFGAAGVIYVALLAYWLWERRHEDDEEQAERRASAPPPARHRRTP